MEKKLWVKMFGGFSVYYGDEVLGFSHSQAADTPLTLRQGL